MSAAMPSPPPARDEALRERCFAEMAALIGRDHVVVSTGAARFRVELREWFEHLEDHHIETILLTARGLATSVIRGAGFLSADKIFFWSAQQRVDIPEGLIERFRELVVWDLSDEVAKIVLDTTAHPPCDARIGENCDAAEIGRHLDQGRAQFRDIGRKSGHRHRPSKKAKGRR